MLSFQHGPKFIESVKTPNTPEYLRIYTPPKTGETRRWRIIDEETGKIVDSYTPPVVTKPTPMSRKGSWMEWVKNPEAVRKLISQQTIPAIFATRANPGNCIFLNPKTAG